MPLPLNLAMTKSEIAAAPFLPTQIAWMACHFSPGGEGLDDLPMQLPEGAMLILDDSIPCRGHSADWVADTLCKVAARFHCCGVLLDFQRPENEQAAAIAAALAESLPCPVGITPDYAAALSCAVFLPPAPLHAPMDAYLCPWKDREIWLEAALCQEVITVTKEGTSFSALPYPGDLSNGFFDEKLCCRYMTKIQDDNIIFTLFDTFETLEKKLEIAHSCGITRAVGLYQELGQHFAGR